VGINKSASRVSGLRADVIIMIVFIITGFLSGIAGLIYSSRISSCDSNNAGVNYEMDAILAVVIGGTSMSGGKFNLAGTVMGSLIIRTITTLVYYFGIVSEAIMAFKALVIAVVIVLQSEPVRRLFATRRQSTHKAMGGEARA
jgi:simple sugar transport system permease protein